MQTKVQSHRPLQLCSTVGFSLSFQKMVTLGYKLRKNVSDRIKRYSISAVFCLLALSVGTGCDTQHEFSSDPRTNFRALWEILDQGYCYFDLKLPADSTWEDYYHKHAKDVHRGMSTDELFRKMNALIRELKDGHVNVITPFDYGRYWDWRDNYPSSLDKSVRSLYLGKDYRIAGGLHYERIRYNNHSKDRIGLVVFNSFSSSVSHSNINAVLSRLSDCKGLIFDIRENGGGSVDLSDRLASHFIDKKRLVGYIRHKTGPKHDQFSKPMALYVEPVSRGFLWHKPVVLLVDRGVYSAANDFVLKMKDIPHVFVMGDHTGGGAGMPFSSELPNGWGVRYSASRMLDKDMQDIEFGIAPHKRVPLSKSDLAQGYDSLIESAIKYILQAGEKSK